MFGQISGCLNVEQEEKVGNGLAVSQDIVIGEKKKTVDVKLPSRQRLLPYSFVRLALLLNGTWLQAFTTVFIIQLIYINICFRIVPLTC